MKNKELYIFFKNSCKTKRFFFNNRMYSKQFDKEIDVEVEVIVIERIIIVKKGFRKNVVNSCLSVYDTSRHIVYINLSSSII